MIEVFTTNNMLLLSSFKVRELDTTKKNIDENSYKF